MFDTIISFMNKFQAGSVILFFAGIGFILKYIITTSIKVINIIKARVLKDKNETDTKAKMLEDIDNVKNDVNSLSEEFQSSLNIFSEKLMNHVNESTAQREELLHMLHTLNELVQSEDPKIEALEERIKKIESQISILLESDKEYMTAFITDSYNRYVKEQKSIDLLTLQHIESIYTRFLTENGVVDEFISKLMKELRDLPTIKRSNDC